MCTWWVGHRFPGMTLDLEKAGNVEGVDLASSS
jgi:hypothetical protein